MNLDLVSRTGKRKRRSRNMKAFYHRQEPVGENFQDLEVEIFSKVGTPGWQQYITSIKRKKREATVDQITRD